MLTPLTATTGVRDIVGLMSDQERGPVATNIREVRLLVPCPSGLRAMAKLFFSNADGSIHLMPYGPTGEYYCGVGEFGAEKREGQVNFKAQHAASEDRIPKLSLHESGRVHPSPNPIADRPNAQRWLANGKHDAQSQRSATYRYDATRLGWLLGTRSVVVL